MALLLRNMTVYTRFNRFKHCAINKEEKHKLMTRTSATQKSSSAT